jgi:hypothetical protein
MLPIKKLYLDSRFKSGDSASDSDFKVDLPTTLLMPQNTVFYVDDVSIPVSWYSVEEGRNNKLYFYVDGVRTVLSIPSGNYTVTSLNNALVEAMNGFYPEQFTADPQVNTNQVKISSNSAVFGFLTDSQALAAGYSSPLHSINNVLRNTSTTQLSNSTQPFLSQYIDLFPVRNLYITSPNLGNYNTMSVSGERGIIKKVPVTANYNEMIFDQVVLGSDYLDCSRQTLSRLEFQLKDVFGNVVDLNGNHWSFSIVFSHLPVED